MNSPFDIINQSNFSGQFSLPPFTPYDLLTLNNLPNSYGVTGTPPFVAPNNTYNNGCPNCPQIVTAGDAYGNNQLDPNATGAPQSLSTIGGFLGIDFEKFFKNYMLISLAVVLLTLGLYMLAVSTDVGRNTIATGAKAIAI